MDERIIRYCEGTLPAGQQRELLEEARENPLLKAEIIDCQHLHSLLGLRTSQADRRLGKEKYDHFKKLVCSRKRRQTMLTFVRYAALFILAFLSSGILAVYFLGGDRPEEADRLAMGQELYIPPGQRGELVLPDGTKVWLNAGSRLSYPSVFEGERKVRLSGEAYFEVAKNEQMPFIVSTKTVEIKALGTRFNVFSYPGAEYASVYLKQGSVKVYFPAAESKGLLLQPEQRVVQQGNTLSRAAADPDDLLWREGIYSFKKQKLGSIIRKLELYYDVRILVRDKRILEYEYVGKFRQRDGVMEILRLIQRIHKFKIYKDDELNQIVLSE